MIKNFKSLKKLYIQAEFTSEFIFKLKNIEELTIDWSKNIIFEKDNLNELKILLIYNSQNIIIKNNCLKSLKKIYLDFDVCDVLKSENKNKLNFPELEDYKKFSSFANNNSSFMNFKRLKKLKYFYSDIDDFLSLGDNLLEKVEIKNNEKDGAIKEINMIKKLILIKTLKEIEIKLYNIEHKDLIPIYTKNNSVKKIKLEYKNENTEYFDFYNLINLFPNLSELDFNISMNKGNPRIILGENKNCNLTKLYFLEGKLFR